VLRVLYSLDKPESLMLTCCLHLAFVFVSPLCAAFLSHTAGARDPRCPPENTEAKHKALVAAGNTPEGMIITVRRDARVLQGRQQSEAAHRNAEFLREAYRWGAGAVNVYLIDGGDPKY
jgi:hypothetical protein